MNWKDHLKRFCRETFPRLAGNLLLLFFAVLSIREIQACVAAGSPFAAISNVLKAWFFATVAGLLLVRLYLPSLAEKITFGLLFPKKFLKAAPPPLSRIHTLISQGDSAAAEQQLSELVRKYPGQAEIALMQIALYADRLKRSDLAEAAAENYFAAAGRGRGEHHFRILMRYADLLQGTDRETRLRNRLEEELKDNRLTGPQGAAVRRRLENLHG